MENERRAQSQRKRERKVNSEGKITDLLEKSRVIFLALNI